jgi:hypothetical protein
MRSVGRMAVSDVSEQQARWVKLGPQKEVLGHPVASGQSLVLWQDNSYQERGKKMGLAGD